MLLFKKQNAVGFDCRPKQVLQKRVNTDEQSSFYMCLHVLLLMNIVPDQSPLKVPVIKKTKVAVLQTGAKRQLQVEKPIQTDL